MASRVPKTWTGTWKRERTIWDGEEDQLWGLWEVGRKESGYPEDHSGGEYDAEGEDLHDDMDP